MTTILAIVPQQELANMLAIGTFFAVFVITLRLGTSWVLRAPR